MALKWQKKTITLSKGMRDDVDQFQLEPPYCQEIKNGVFDKEGVVSKRKGLETVATGAPSGTPVGILEGPSESLVVQGTSGLNVVSGSGYQAVPSNLVTSTSEKERSTPSGIEARGYKFDESAGNFCDIWMETVDASASTSYFKWRAFSAAGLPIEGSVSLTDTPLACNCKLTSTEAQFVYVYQSGTNIFAEYFSYLLSSGATSQTRSHNFVAQAETVDTANQPGTDSRAFLTGEGTVRLWTHIYDLSGAAKFSIVHQDAGLTTNQYRNISVDTGAAVTATLGSGDLKHVYVDNSYVVILLRFSSTVAQYRKYDHIGALVDANNFTVSSDYIARAGYARGGGYQIVFFSYITHHADATGYDFWHGSNLAGPIDLGHPGTSHEIQSDVFHDPNEDNTWAARGTLYDEIFCTDIVTDGTNAYVGSCPAIQNPFLGRTVGEAQVERHALAYKPYSITLHEVSSASPKLAGTVSANTAYAYEYRKLIRSDHLCPAKLSSGILRVGSREIASAPNAGVYQKVGVANQPDSDPYPTRRPTTKHVVYRIDYSDAIPAITSAAGTVLPGTSLATYSGNTVEPAYFTNAPEISEVFYKGDSAGAVSGFISCMYEPALGSGFDFSPSEYYSIGVVAVLKYTTAEGREIVSAPSSTVYIPVVWSGSYVTDFTFGVYLPPHTPEGAKVSFYALNSESNLADPGQDLSSGSAYLVGSYSVKDTTTGKPANMGPKYWIPCGGFTGITNVVSGKIRGRVSPNVGSELLYTETELAADVPPGQKSAVAAGGRLFFTDGENVYYTKYLRTNKTPQSPAAFFTPLSKKNPVHLESLDDKVIVFYRDSISVLFGQGPDDLGNGSDFSQQELPGSVGLLDVNSVVSTPAGIIFRSDSGFYTLDRGLSLTPIEGVSDILRGCTVTSAVTLESEQICIFSLTLNSVPAQPTYATTNPPGAFIGNLAYAGVALVYSYRTGDWTTFTNFDFSAMADIGGVLRGVRSDWSLLQQHDEYEDDDTNDSSRQNLLTLRTPWIKFDTLQGYSALRRVSLLGRYYSALTDNGSGDLDAGNINISLYYDYEWPRAVDSYAWKPSEVPHYPRRFQLNTRPGRRKCQAVQIAIIETKTADSGGTTYRVGRGFEISAIDLQVGLKDGLSKLPKGRKR